MTAAGMARMPARVMMALAGSPDDGYTAAELAERLGVSAAAVSGAVRYLQSIRLIDRISRPGHRRDRYELAADAWHGVVSGNAPTYIRLADLMEAIADQNADAEASARRPSRSSRATCTRSATSFAAKVAWAEATATAD